MSVYDLDISGELNESSDYSNLNDPYSKIKRKIEYELEKNVNQELILLFCNPRLYMVLEVIGQNMRFMPVKVQV